MPNSNADSYLSLGWILNNSEDGIFFLIATEKMQQEVVSHYITANVAIYDYKQRIGNYSFNTLENWINSIPQANAYFIVNFQLAIQNEESIKQLNFSRDMLDSLHKNFIFCVTQRADDILVKSASDFYSYIKLRIFFQEEFFEKIKEPQLPPLNFDKSTNIDHKVPINFELPQAQLLSQAIALINQADQLNEEFRYSDALQSLKKALVIREKLLSEQHPDTAMVYKKIADVYSNQRNYSQALNLYNKALVIREKVLGKEHPATATTYNNIAGVYSNQGDYTQALEWYNKALVIREKVLGKEHPYTATTYNNIAGVHKNQGDYAQALEWLNKALIIREKILGKEHPNTAATYNNIALVYSDQGNYTQALEWFNKALAIREKVLGKEHPDTAATYNNIAGVYSNQGDYAQALELYNKALAIREKVLGKGHPDTDATYNNIAIVYKNAQALK